jgi:hypothetical protein
MPVHRIAVPRTVLALLTLASAGGCVRSITAIPSPADDPADARAAAAPIAPPSQTLAIGATPVPAPAVAPKPAAGGHEHAH